MYASDSDKASAFAYSFHRVLAALNVICAVFDTLHSGEGSNGVGTSYFCPPHLLTSSKLGYICYYISRLVSYASSQSYIIVLISYQNQFYTLIEIYPGSSECLSV